MGVCSARTRLELPDPLRFDEFFGFPDHLSAHFHRPATLWRNEQEVPAGGYSHDLFTAEAIDFITRHAGHPFLLYLAYTVPHPAIAVPADSMVQYHSTKCPTLMSGSATSPAPKPRSQG